MTTLKHLRIKAGLTQMEVAKKLGFTSPQYISNAERGLTRISYKHFRAIAKLYGVDVEVLIKDELKAYEKELRGKV